MGKTLTGQWSAYGRGGGYTGDAISYRIPLESPPAANTAHYLTPGSTTTQCPGPGQAQSGHLCVYDYVSASVSTGGIYGIDGSTLTDDRGGKDGFQIYFSTGGTSAAYAYGTWAVTG